jgi:L,D-transpeptidase ErfK/SrfK
VYSDLYRKLTGVMALLLSCCLAQTAVGASYRLPENGDSVVGAVTRLKLTYEDTLAAVAERYGIGYRELVDANPDVDPWIPGEGTVIELPTQYVLPNAPRDGVVINVAEYRLYFYPPSGDRVITYPVGIGRSEFRTPEIHTRTVARIENPSWTPTDAARREHAEMGDILPHVVPPGPENPLGDFAIQLEAPGYFIHGTNKPFGVGQQVSHGCIRLHNAHILTLAELVPNGTPVYIVNQPIKAGLRYDELYLESHRDIYDELNADTMRAAVEAVLEKAVGEEVHADADANWQRVARVVTDLRGVPVRI